MSDTPRRMPIEARVRRAVSRRNNKTRRRYPLFDACGLLEAEGWLTTPQAEYERLQRQGEEASEYLARLEAGEAEFFERAAAYRAELAALISAEELAALGGYVADPRRHWLRKGHYLADRWHTWLRAVRDRGATVEELLS